jgi:N-dimethylarginine dimethylaminohydrolase
MRAEIGRIWGACGVNSEWTSLKAVLVHRPGLEIESIEDANRSLMRQIPSAALARRQHDKLIEAYRRANVNVFYVQPDSTPPPNQMFVADLFFMTPEGVILARPASAMRAGEERFVAKRLIELGIPILRSVRGNGVFEGADALWISPSVAIVATGLRTNIEGAGQVTNLLNEMDVEVIQVALSQDTMHLMGALRFVDENLAMCWKPQIPDLALETLRDFAYDVAFIPDRAEAVSGMALNFVTLGPRHVLMPSGNPNTQSFYEDMGIQCVTVRVDELHKAAGGIACLTGVLNRARV